MIRCAGNNRLSTTVCFKLDNVIDCGPLEPNGRSRVSESNTKATGVSAAIPIPESPMDPKPQSDTEIIAFDEALADYRDFCMFSRIVNGMTRRQFSYQNTDLLSETRYCIANICQTREQPPKTIDLQMHSPRSPEYYEHHHLMAQPFHDAQPQFHDDEKISDCENDCPFCEIRYSIVNTSQTQQQCRAMMHVHNHSPRSVEYWERHSFTDSRQPSEEDEIFAIDL